MHTEFSSLFSRSTVKGLNATVVSRALSSLHGGPREITLIVPLSLQEIKKSLVKSEQSV